MIVICLNEESYEKLLDTNYPQLTALRLIEPLNYFETHYWRFRQTYCF